MRVSGSLFLLLLLASCTGMGVPLPPEGTPQIEIAEGSGFSGLSRTRVYVDDTVAEEASRPGGRETGMTVRQGRTGLFRALSALIAAEGPGVAVKSDQTDVPLCLDYGNDVVQASPPVSGVGRISFSCPDPAMRGFMDKLRALVAGAV